MKGCARTCLLQFVAWAVISGAFFWYFRGLGGPDEAQLYWASVGAGLFVMASILYAVGIFQAWRERASLTDAISGAPPRDGAWVAVSGRIQSMDATKAPLSGESVVAYEYKIWRHEGSGKSSMDVTYYSGKALVPSTIATRHGSVRLLAVPAFTDISPAQLDHMRASENAREYIASTQFETPETPKDQRTVMDHELADDDGNFRVDKKPVGRDIDPRECQLEERHIRQGEAVCAFGLFSQQRGGIIPHPNWAKHTRLMRGDGEEVAQQLRSRMIKYVFGVVIFAGLAYGVFYLYTSYVAKIV
jgi:hypothetical protein